MLEQDLARDLQASDKQGGLIYFGSFVLFYTIWGFISKPNSLLLLFVF